MILLWVRLQRFLEASSFSYRCSSGLCPHPWILVLCTLAPGLCLTTHIIDSLCWSPSLIPEWDLTCLWTLVLAFSLYLCVSVSLCACLCLSLSRSLCVSLSPCLSLFLAPHSLSPFLSVLYLSLCLCSCLCLSLSFSIAPFPHQYLYLGLCFSLSSRRRCFAPTEVTVLYCL